VTAIDTNVLIDVVEDDASRSQQVLAVLDARARKGALVVSPAVYAELCAHPGWSALEVDRFLASLTIRVDWKSDAETWRKTSAAFSDYAHRRRRSGSSTPRRLLADFFIGAHATLCGTFITRDGAFFAHAFPGLNVLTV
jgi:predicted nucleic acid-binding protein